MIVGVVANLIDPQPARGGLLAAIALGIAGALLGGFLSSLILGVGVTGFDFSSFVVAFIGALILLFVGRELRRA